MTFKNPNRPNPEGRWTNTAQAMVTAFSPSQIGDYQEHIHQDSNGFLYSVVVTDTGLGRLVVELYSNSGTAAEADLNFPNGPTMALVSNTTIAKGYPYDFVALITEISTVLFGRKVYVAMLYTDIVHGRVCELFEFDIGTFACTHLRYFKPSVAGEEPNYRSIDIDKFYGTGTAFLWLSMVEFNASVERYVWWQSPLPHEPQSEGNYLDTIITELNGSDLSGVNQYLACRHCFDDRQLFSVSHGNIVTTGLTPTEVMTVPAASPANTYENFVGWLIPNDQQQMSDGTTRIIRYPRPFQVQSAPSVREIDVAGLYDINFNQKYSAQMLLRWRRGADANATSWELWFGVREQGVITYSAMILTIDYSSLLVIDIETQLEDNGIYPECGITVNSKGVTYVYALFPSLRNLPVGDAGPGALDDDPYYDIWMLHYGDNNWYQPNQQDWEVVEDGWANQRACRYLSTPNRIDGGRQPKFERLYLLTQNTAGLANSFTTHTRHPGDV